MTVEWIDEPRDDDNDGETNDWFDCHDGSIVPMDVVNDTASGIAQMVKMKEWATITMTTRRM